MDNFQQQLLLWLMADLPKLGKPTIPHYCTKEFSESFELRSEYRYSKMIKLEQEGSYTSYHFNPNN